MGSISLTTPIQDLFMVGKTYCQRLKKLDIKSVEDLLHHYPFRYDDFRLISPIAQLQPEEKVTVQGVVLASQNIYTKYGKKIQKAVIQDQSGRIEAIWFNQPFIPKNLKPGARVSLSGKVGTFNYKTTFVSPDYELISRQTIHTGRLVPIYPETYGVSSKWLRSRIFPLLEKLLSHIQDFLPPNIKTQENLVNLAEALQKIHFPRNEAEISQAEKRLKFDELFLIQLKTALRRKQWEKNKISHNLIINQDKVLGFLSSLPFELTLSQKKALKEILANLAKKRPMNRLLEGDVGSGKTVVAACAMYVTFLNGFQSTLMAPTEILATQHFQTIKTLLEPFGAKISLLTSSRKLKSGKSGLKSDIFVGTHALIYNKLNLTDPSLVVIDEQHRFGVEQRAQLIKKGKTPHILTMTATPIPRTIALTLYGDLDLSCLDELPKGRKQIKTWVVPWHKRNAAYEWITTQIQKEKSQAFIVCPLIEQSEKESMKNIKAVTVEFERLSQQVFPEFKLALLHGRLKSVAKDKILADFKNKKTDILVSTPVVEVGIDIPAATIMMIEGAERFGLAQLHQLRGRVGRSYRQSYCLLFTSQKDKESLKRLKAMEQNYSGFKLAEIDLKLRGPGEIYGTKQHGFSQLKIASYSDANLIEKTKLWAKKIAIKLDQFPLLKDRLKKYTIKDIEAN